MSIDINAIVLTEIQNLGPKKFAADWGFPIKAVKMVQQTGKPSAAMLTRAFELMTQQPNAPQQQVPIAQPRRAPRATGRTPVAQPFQRAAGIASMFTRPDGMDMPASTVRPAAGAPMVVPPSNMPGVIPMRHAGIAMSQPQLHAQPMQQGVQIPAGVDPAMWMMFCQFMAMMGMGPAPANTIELPGGSLEMPQNYGMNWNIPYNHQPQQDEQQPGPRRAPRRRVKQRK